MDEINRTALFGPRALWMGVYDGLSARMVSRAWQQGSLPGLSALWVSSFCVSASLRACPDASIVSATEMISVGRHVETAAQGLPIVLDCDCGYGDVDVFQYVVTEICRTSRIAAICFEDKVFPKRNSFYGQHEQQLESLDMCVAKIAGAVAARDVHRDDLAVVARTEALVAGEGVTVTLERLAAFAEAGADALMVQATGAREELDEVCRLWGERSAIPMVAAPTMYPTRSPQQFWDSGFGVYIYANHLLRAAGHAAEEMLLALSDTVVAPADMPSPMWSVTQLNELVGASATTRGAMAEDRTERRPDGGDPARRLQESPC
jgi:phosphoenolpyruvate phosphomutase